MRIDILVHSDQDQNKISEIHRKYMSQESAKFHQFFL